MLSTSRDDTLRVWDAKNSMAQLASIRHNNNTGRWVVPFRAVWGAASDSIIVGGMKRTVGVTISIAAGQHTCDGADWSDSSQLHMNSVTCH